MVHTTTVMPGRAFMLAFLLSCVRPGTTQGQKNVGVTFESKTEAMYDTKPKLRLRGSGFLQLSEEDLLQLKFDPPLTDPSILSTAKIKSDDTINLELTQGKKWISLEAQEKRRALVLTEAFCKGESLLSNPVTVATVVPTPTVYPSTNIVYLTTSPHLKINGTNFDVKKTDLFFSPPLLVGTDVSVFVKSPTLIWVALAQKAEGKQWAAEPGPLKLTAIDTGAGMLKLREDLGGTTIAEMQADMQGHGISVEAHEEISMYQSTRTLTVAGTGFRKGDTRFRFGNALEAGTNYTVDVSSTSAIFSLTPGSKWQKNLALLPGPLLLLAADAGDGFVPLGATLAKAGRKVATVFEDPSVNESHTKISRTHTHELIVSGTGFNKVFPPLLVFEPIMDRDDYVLHVLNRTHVKVSLAGEANGWMQTNHTGNLTVRAINTGAGMFPLEKPVKVAEVVPDDGPHHSGITVFPVYTTQLYQTSTIPLIIKGEGFPLDTPPALQFGYAGPPEEGFTCSTVSETSLEVVLAEGYSWATQGGPLLLTGVTFGEHEVVFKSPGVKVATILDDPFVEASQLHVYATHTRQITIKGSGFMSAFNPSVKPLVILSPTTFGEYTIKDGDWTDASMTISLLPSGRSDEHEGKSKWADLRTPDERMSMKVLSIDTGAGAVSMPGGGIVVAEVRMDDDSFSCEDSCIYANDGQCDEDQNGEKNLKWEGYNSRSNGESLTSQASSSRGYLGSSSTVDGADDLILTGIPSCQIGTDCTDCGLHMVDTGMCSNDCEFARDGSCDDRRETGVCPDGTDCQDCGPWGESNYTQAGSSMSQVSLDAYDDDDSGFLARDVDDPMFMGQIGNAMGRYKRVFAEHKILRKESESAESVFMETLWAATVLVGFSVVAFILVLAVRCAKGESVNLTIPTNPDVQGRR